MSKEFNDNTRRDPTASESSERSSSSIEPSRELTDRYRIREKIGEGGFGIVYAAEQVNPVRRRVAVKVIKPGMDSKSVIARFEAERQALAVMNHPGVATLRHHQCRHIH